MASFNTVAIIGLGLIGGSLGQRIQLKMPKIKVVGVPRRAATIKEALKAKAIKKGTLNIKEAVSDADLVIIATPIELVVSKFKEMMPYLKIGAVVLDVASTKTEIVLAIEALCPQQVYYVGGHPMAGSEKSGIDAADHLIFEKAMFVLTQTNNTSRKALSAVAGFIKKLGMKTMVLKPAVHDFMVAAISHLPYIVATTLTATVAEMKPYQKQLQQLMAGGFRDTSRVSSASPQWGKSIFKTNRDQIIEVLELYQRRLNKIRMLLDKGKFAEAEKFFSVVKSFRDKLYKQG